MGRRRFPNKLRRGFVMVAVVIALVVSLVPVAAMAAPAQREAASYSTYHTVRPGDTLTRIAAHYGVSVHAIMRANHLYDPNHIYVGQVLVIPHAGGLACAFYHTVQHGQTLSGIAAYYGVSSYALMQANKIYNANHIYTGQKLCIPGTGGPVYEPDPVYHDGFYYTVRPGDSVSELAVRFGTTVSAIVKANNLAHPSRIYVGQKLFIPTYGYTPPAPPPYKPPPSKPVPPPPTVKPEFGGPWTGLYYNNTSFSGPPALVRTDPAINFDFGLGAPAPGVNGDFFSAIWTTTEFFEQGTWRFFATADDGVRVFVDDQLVIDAFRIGPAQGFFGDIFLHKGHHVIRVEYFEESGFSVVNVSWALDP